LSHEPGHRLDLKLARCSRHIRLREGCGLQAQFLHTLFRGDEREETPHFLRRAEFFDAATLARYPYCEIAMIRTLEKRQ
jgi:hypothetical protein